MESKDIRELYKIEKGITDDKFFFGVSYVQWLESKYLELINSKTNSESKINLSDLVGEYSLNEIPSVMQEIENRINEAKQKKSFIEVHGEWLDSFHCDDCGNDGIDDFFYKGLYSNGEEWKCKGCGHCIVIDQEPNPDNF